MKIAVVGDEHLVWGFQLSGVHSARIVTNAVEAEEACSQYLRDPTIGIILLLQDFAVDMKAFLTGIKRDKRLYPVIILISGKRADGVPLLIEEDLMRMVGMDGVGVEKK